MSKADLGLSRRRLLLGVSALTLAGCAVGLSGELYSASGAPAPSSDLNAGRKQPNIIFIMADDLGYADVSCYGRREYQTPAIDSLAETGMRFMQAYSNSPVCSATRTALITGRYQYRLPVGLEEPLTSRKVGLPPSHPTLPGQLRKAGYQTALVGKWHLGALPDYGPLKSGYDHFWGVRGGSVDYFRHESMMGQNDLWDGETEFHETAYLTELFGDRSVEMIDQMSQDGKPFFLSLHFTAPHWPWEGPDDRAESERIKDAGQYGLLHLDGGSLETYAEMVVSMDQQIARVISKLQELGIEDETIIVFTSDNGGERFADTWPFSGIKTELLEGGLRVPMIVRWPGVTQPGSVSQQVTMSMDMMPTLLHVGSASPDPDFPSDGIDLTDALKGAAPAPRDVYFRYMNLDQKALRSGDWKYLKIADVSYLFNVEEDPKERANLIARYPEKFAELKTQYDDWEASMLPLDPAANTHGYTGEMLADHFHVTD
tara:strand:- start:22350 stop:23807 length:1458 start_codon:yes stop_codon:yes gene_type:complete